MKKRSVRPQESATLRNRWKDKKWTKEGEEEGEGEQRERERKKEALRKCGGALTRKRGRARGKLRDPLAQIAKAATPSTILLTTNLSLL